MHTLLSAFEHALARRGELLSQLHAAQTDTYRLLHGAAEQAPGVTIDRYGEILLLQTWRDPLPEGALSALHAAAEAATGAALTAVWNHRRRPIDFPKWHPVSPPPQPIATELGLRWDARPRHRGQDPLLFLDFRAARRLVRAHSAGRSVLNLFAYTCGVGVAAAAGGAREVWNVDFAASALDVGRTNAQLNQVDDARTRWVQSDCLPAMRQLSGLGVRARRGRSKRYPRMEARTFDLVVLDPPRWATSAFGAVDLVRDYQSLFKPALLSTAPGGHMLVTNNVAKVAREGWIEDLKRCATKAGRPLRRVELIPPEADFPSFDGRHPLKMAWIEVGS